MPTLHGDVKYQSVTFRYNGSLPNVLTNVTLHVRAGETIALVGPSGGGKTTLAKLLLRLYDPTEGLIMIDGHDIRDMDLETLRQHVTIVPQEVALFPGTVAENIAYGELPNVRNMEKVKQAAIFANAHDFVSKLPSGYETELSDRASCLSGGQRQRLAIARAIYKQPSILILDEATSALDNISEKLVREALDRLMKGRTVSYSESLPKDSIFTLTTISVWYMSVLFLLRGSFAELFFLWNFPGGNFLKFLPYTGLCGSSSA